jgi:ATP phosphoribosyltransferase
VPEIGQRLPFVVSDALPRHAPQVCELHYSKATSNPARWVLAVPEDSPVQTAEDLAGSIVASELVNTTRK